MDRTVIAPWKAEEKELSEKLYNKLNGLALVYPMSEEFRKVMAWDMFLKPNQPAFFQAMHYLFRLLDAMEFKRRFFWPITDKRSEANFRASTVEYLKSLNEKHQLKWTNITSYLVVKPGGMKFITYLLDFVDFVTQDLIKHREKALFVDPEMRTLKSLDINIMSKQNMLLKEFTLEYLAEIEDQINVINEQVQTLNKVFNDIAVEVGMSVDQLLSERLLLDFDESNQNLCKGNLVYPTEEICSLEKPISDLQETIGNFLNKEAEQCCEKTSVKNALHAIQDVMPGENMNQNSGKSFSAPDDAVEINNLVQAFCSINDTLEHQLATNDERNCHNSFLNKELTAIQSEIKRVESQLNDLQKELNATAQPKSSELFTPLKDANLEHPPAVMQNPLMQKYVTTPSIKLELGSTPQDSANIRLPLQENFNIKLFDTFNASSMFSIVPPKPARKVQVPTEAAKAGMFNKSKILDPMWMLRALQNPSFKGKRVAQQRPSVLSLNWQKQQERFSLDVEPLVLASPSAISLPLEKPETLYTPFKSNEQTLIETTKFTSQCNDDGSGKLYKKRNSAVMKVLDSTLNVQNQSDSPSGRLEALVTEHRLPKFQLNDVTVDDTRDCINNRSPDDKNNLNVLNSTDKLFKLDLIMNADELSLNDVSDSVLNDISM